MEGILPSWSVKHWSIFSFVFWGCWLASIFLRSGFSFGETCQSWGGAALASVSYCAGWRITSRAQKAEVLISLMFQIFNSVSSQMNGLFTHVKVVHGGPSRCLPSLGLPSLRMSNVKGPLYITFSYKKNEKKYPCFTKTCGLCTNSDQEK